MKIGLQNALGMIHQSNGVIAEAEKLRLERILKMDAGGLDNIETMLPRVVDRYRDLVENSDGGAA